MITGYSRRMPQCVRLIQRVPFSGNPKFHIPDSVCKILFPEQANRNTSTGKWCCERFGLGAWRPSRAWRPRAPARRTPRPAASASLRGAPNGIPWSGHEVVVVRSGALGFAGGGGAARRIAAARRDCGLASRAGWLAGERFSVVGSKGHASCACLPESAGGRNGWAKRDTHRGI